jgi:hypothetical protein
MKTKTIKLAGKNITLTKLSIRKLADTINGLANLPDELKTTLTNLDTLSNDQALAQFPTIIATALPHMAGMVAKACDSKDVTEEYLLDECGFDDAIELVEAWLELNNVVGIMERIKKMQALYLRNAPRPTQLPPKTAQGNEQST